MAGILWTIVVLSSLALIFMLWAKRGTDEPSTRELGKDLPPLKFRTSMGDLEDYETEVVLVASLAHPGGKVTKKVTKSSATAPTDHRPRTARLGTRRSSRRPLGRWSCGLTSAGTGCACPHCFFMISCRRRSCARRLPGSLMPCGSCASSATVRSSICRSTASCSAFLDMA